jgi:hypothetical protein
MKISTRKIDSCIRIFLLAAFLAAAIYLFLFLKTYFYPSITGSQTMLVMQKNMAAETINLERFNELIKNINEKTLPETNQSPISDPFK